MYANEAKTSEIDPEHYSYRFTWLHLFRPMTLTGTITPALVGTALAAQNGHIRLDLFFAYLMAVLLIQATTNMLNDYFDFKHGQDQEKWISLDEPGYGNGPHYHSIPFAAAAMILMAALIGVWLAAQSSYWIILVGALGIIFGYFYSAGPYPLSSLGLGELVAAVFLGFVSTSLPYVIQGHPFDSHIFIVALTFALLISSLILTNNIRDMAKDLPFRRTIAIRIGRIKASRLLFGLLLFVYIWMFVLMIIGAIPWIAAGVLLASPLAYRLAWSLRPGSKREDEIKGMKLAAQHHWAFGLLFAACLWITIL